VAQFVTTKINVNTLSLEQYISTENMLPNIGGIEPITSLPAIQKCTSFKENDILFSNIRTYFKKVWMAEFDGGCSPDVLVIRSKDERVLLNKYLFLLIRSDDFINFTAMASNGAKMPRGDKKAMLKYEFNIPSIEEQKRIIKQQFTLTDKIQLNTQINQTLEQIAQAKQPVGLKISGGVRDIATAQAYIAQAAAKMGEDWVQPENFRIGASSLLKELISC